MSISEKWLTTLGVLGLTATALAAVLVWMVLTYPFVLVEAIAGTR